MFNHCPLLSGTLFYLRRLEENNDVLYEYRCVGQLYLEREHVSVRQLVNFDMPPFRPEISEIGVEFGVFRCRICIASLCF